MPNLWVCSEQTACSSRSPFGLCSAKPVPSEKGWPSQTVRWSVSDMADGMVSRVSL